MAGALEALVVTNYPEWPNADRLELPAVPLTAGFALVPLRTDPASTSTLRGGFERLTEEVATRAERLSAHGPVMYLHLEFWGGTGFHAVIVWDEGAVAFGPMFTANHASEALTSDYEITTDLAANRALRSLGVSVGEARDEYAAIGLDRFRWTEEWLEQAART